MRTAKNLRFYKLSEFFIFILKFFISHEFSSCAALKSQKFWKLCRKFCNFGSCHRWLRVATLCGMSKLNVKRISWSKLDRKYCFLLCVLIEDVEGAFRCWRMFFDTRCIWWHRSSVSAADAWTTTSFAWNLTDILCIDMSWFASASWDVELAWFFVRKIFRICRRWNAFLRETRGVSCMNDISWQKLGRRSTCSEFPHRDGLRWNAAWTWGCQETFCCTSSSRSGRISSSVFALLISSAAVQFR